MSFFGYSSGFSSTHPTGVVTLKSVIEFGKAFMLLIN